MVTTVAVAFAAYFPLSEASRRLADIVPLSVVHAARAENLARTGMAGDRRLLEEIRRLSERELREAPESSGAWLRLAEVHTAENSERLDPKASLALYHSYRSAPIDYTIARSRLLFVFDHWQEVDPAIRARAVTEFKILWSKTMLRTRLEELPSMTSDGAGRMAAELLVESLRDGDVSF